MSVQKLDHLVVDTSGFLKNVPLWNYAENLVTIREVFDEIKDPELKNYVLAFPVPVSFREPNQKSIDFVVEFSKKTGDYIALSVPDIKVMALAHQMEVERNGDQHLRTEPTRRQCNANTTYHSNVTASNVNDSNVTDSRVTDSNLTDDSKVTDSNVIDSKVTDSNVTDSKPTESNVTNSNIIGDSIDLLSTDSIKLSQESGAKENLPSEDVAEENEGSEEEEEEDDDGEGWCMQKGKRGKKMNRKPKRQQFNKSDARSVTTSGSRRRNLDLRYNLPGWYISHDKPETVAEEGEENSEEEEEEDDDECWVTPENLHEFPTTDEVEHLEEDEDQQIEDHPDIACMTGDFAMQNVLRQIGLPVIGVDGKLIRRTRCYVLRCHTCFHVTHIMDKLFCPRCGNMTMKRVAMTTNEDGSQQLWISSKPLSARGLKFQLPKPRGGPHAVKPLLTADQRFPHQRAKINRKLDLQNAQCIDDAPFAYKDVSSRAFAQGNVGTLGYKGHFAHAKIWRPKKRRMVQK